MACNDEKLGIVSKTFNLDYALCISKYVELTTLKYHHHQIYPEKSLSYRALENV